MKIAMVDDVEKDLDLLEKTLKEYFAKRHIQADFYRFASGEEFLENYSPLLYKIIFLDVYMQGMTGIETARKIREKDDETFIIFLTASDSDQTSAIHYNVYDYILKDDCTNEVCRVVEKILKKSAETDSDCFLFSFERKNYSILCKDIVSVRSYGNRIIIEDKNGKQYQPRMTFSSARKSLLQNQSFLEILRGVIVNMEFIVEINDTTCIMKDGSCLAVNLRNQKNIIEIWQNYLFSKARQL